MPQSFAAFRQKRGLSQEQVAHELGLKSKGTVSDIENGRRYAGLRLALQIEQWSGGEVSAATLIDTEDRRLLAAARRQTEPAPCAATA